MIRTNSSFLKEIQQRVDSLEREILLLRSSFDVFQEPFFLLTRKKEFLKVNPKALELLSYPMEELSSMTFVEIVPLEEVSIILKIFEDMDEGKEVSQTFHILNRTGLKIPVQLFGHLKGEIFFIQLKDLRERIHLVEEWERTKRQLMEKIKERDEYARELQALKDLFREKVKEVKKMREDALILSYIDDLTGIYNHRFLIQQLTLEVERQRRYPTALSLLMIDIDYFKHYNDVNGHLGGDQVLRSIATLLNQGVRQSDVVARYGGEEFAAILMNAGKEKAREIAERIRRIIADTPFPNERQQPNKNLTVSIGIATYSSKVSTVTDLIREADHALYRAKRKGRNRVEG
ncbi:MAG: diguanylate cyclase [Thermodesulfobacteriota bacterium]